MSKTFVFEELDDATKEYLLTARNREGRGLPGVFVKSSNALPVLGCIFGPIIIGVVLGITLTPTIIFDEPNGLAMLQTAGILIGVWMILAAFRTWASKRSRPTAGHWAYIDPLHLFEAKAEQVHITPMAEVAEVSCVHNLNNNKYQNTVVTVQFHSGKPRTMTLTDQRRAEAIVHFSNFLAWSRGPEGFGAAPPPPAVLGALAKYVSKHDSMPLDANGAVNLGALELDVPEIPPEPQRARSAAPNLLMYFFLLILAVGIYFAMREVDVPLRDDAIFNLVSTPPVQPVFLRQYLADDRNQLHREAIYKQLGPFYDHPINQVKANVRDAKLKEGMMKLLESLKRADQPVVSLLVVEQTPPVGGDAGKTERSTKVRDLLVRRMVETLNSVWENTRPQSVDMFDPKPPKMGEQLVNFIETPENATPHLEIRYQFVPEPGSKDSYNMKASITIRDDIQGANSWKTDVYLPRTISPPLKEAERDAWATQFAIDLNQALLGIVVVKPIVGLPAGFDIQ